MKSTVLAGIILVVLGVIALAYQGITYSTHKKILDIGSVQASKKETHTIPLPPIIGGVVLVGGIYLVVIGSRNGQ